MDDLNEPIMMISRFRFELMLPISVLSTSFVSIFFYRLAQTLNEWNEIYFEFYFCVYRFLNGSDSFY